MKYYTSGCVDLKWHYKYYYPPLLSDLVKYTPKWDIELIEKNNHGPVRDLVQLSYVLPKDSLDFLPNKIYNYLIWNKKDNYNDNCDIKWSFCKYIWESHVVLPLIDIEDLQHKIDNQIKDIEYSIISKRIMAAQRREDQITNFHSLQ